MRSIRVSVNLSADEAARLAEITPAGVSAAAMFRRMLREASPPPPASHAEALLLLAESARLGRVQAVIALERATRPTAGEADLDRELRRLLDGD